MAVPAQASDTDDHKALMIAGQVMRNNGRLVRAREILSTCSTDPCPPEEQECQDIRAYCAAKLHEVEPDIPSLTIRVEDDRGIAIRDASVSLDGVPVEVTKPVDADPGRHSVKATYAGRSGTLDVEVARAQKSAPARIVIDLRKEIISRPVPWYTWALGTAAGVAGLTAIGFGIAAQAQANDLSFCYPTCDPSRQGLFTATTVTTDVALGVAVTAALIGVITYFARPSLKKTAHIEIAGGGT